MKVRLRQPAVEARQWDGDMDRMSEWLRANMVLHIHIERDRLNQTRLRVVGPRYTTSLSEGDWLVVHSPTSLSKVTQDEFEESYERAGLHETVSFWTPMVQAQHEITVMIPGMLLAMGDENWDDFCRWLVGFANNTAEDPKNTAYSIG